MKITTALVLLITFSVSAKVGEAVGSPPQDDSDYAGGSGDHAGDPRYWGPTLSPHRPHTPAGEGAVLPPTDYDDEDYADYGSGDHIDHVEHVDHVDLVDHVTNRGSPAPTTTTTTTTTTTARPTTTTTTTTTPPPDVLAENGIYGTVDAAYDDYYDEEYYDESYDETYDSEDYGWEGSGGAAGGDYHDPPHAGADDHGTEEVPEAEVDATVHRDDDLWEDDEGGHGTEDHDTPDHDVEDPIVFEGTTGIESEAVPEEVPHDSRPRPSPDQEVWVPKVGVVPDTPPAEGAAGGEQEAPGEADMDGSVQIVTHKEHERHVSVFAQPGMLAAFIGGAVVGLLCAILLVMFVVYRMRKKDEGSYPLDEPKRVPLTSSYASSGKEIYA